MARRFRLTYSTVLLCCLLCGTAAGTVLANGLGEQLRELAGGFGLQAAAYADLTAGRRRALWGYVARRRFAELGLAALVGMTPLAAGGFAAAAFAAGAVCGLSVSALTLKRGVWGLPVFLLSAMPQWLMYLPVWSFMALRAEEGLDRLRLRDWLLLAVFAAAGTFLEAYGNPLLMHF